MYSQYVSNSGSGAHWAPGAALRVQVPVSDVIAAIAQLDRASDDARKTADQLRDCLPRYSSLVEEMDEDDE